jgi:tRNA pseudouridine38-40 synthase
MNEPALFPRSGFIRIRLDIAYDGSDFFGWGIQARGRTVQGVLQDALSTITRVPVTLTVAGRTDSGVHARGQVAHADLPEEVWERFGPGLHRLMVRLVPPDIRVTSLAEAPVGFDARFSALRRHYVYRISVDPAGLDPLRRRDLIHWHHAVDVELMNSGAKKLIGEHDFIAFCRPRERATTIRTVEQCEVRRDGDIIELHISADAFCHSMVRSVVGALLAVGDGRRPLEWIDQLLQERNRGQDVLVAPARGLTLEAVDYPPDAQLQERADLTRRRRIALESEVNGTP